MELMNSPWFRNLTAKQQYALADALRTGEVSGALGKTWGVTTHAGRQLDENKE
jgi:hypothetical protein